MRRATSITRGIRLASIAAVTMALWYATALAVTGTPTLGPDCGVGAALVGTSSDAAGKVTLGTAVGGTCTLTFGVPYTNAPACSALDETTATPLAPGTTAGAVTINQTAPWNPGDVISYICVAY